MHFDRRGPFLVVVRGWILGTCVCSGIVTRCLTYPRRYLDEIDICCLSKSGVTISNKVFKDLLVSVRTSSEDIHGGNEHRHVCKNRIELELPTLDFRVSWRLPLRAPSSCEQCLDLFHDGPVKVNRITFDGEVRRIEVIAAGSLADQRVPGFVATVVASIDHIALFRGQKGGRDRPHNFISTRG